MLVLSLQQCLLHLSLSCLPAGLLFADGMLLPVFTYRTGLPRWAFKVSPVHG